MFRAVPRERTETQQTREALVWLIWHNLKVMLLDLFLFQMRTRVASLPFYLRSNAQSPPVFSRSAASLTARQLGLARRFLDLAAFFCLSSDKTPFVICAGRVIRHLFRGKFSHSWEREPWDRIGKPSEWIPDATPQALLVGVSCTASRQ